MGKRLFVVFAVLSFAFLGSSFAAVENIKVSGDITTQAIGRDFSLGEEVEESADPAATRTETLDAEDFLFSQIRLRFDADLTENVSATLRLISEEIWGEDNVDDVEVDLAYVELKEFLYQPLTIVIGKQNLRYGNALIIGDPDTNQTSGLSFGLGEAGDLSLRKSFDAAKAILDFSPYTIDLVFAKVNERGGIMGNAATNIDDDVSIYGTNIAYQWSSLGGVTEVYFFASDNAKNGLLYTPVETQVAEDQSKTYNVGGRFQFNPTDQLTLGLEAAYQFGDVFITRQTGTTTFQNLQANAGQAMLEYRFQTQYSPKLNLIYAYFSGDDDITDENWNGWDPMYEDQTAGEIINIFFPNSNAHVVKIAGTMMPREDITLGLAYIWTKLAQKIDAQDYAVRANAWSPPVGPATANIYNVDRNDSYLGSEINAWALYDYTEDVQIKLMGAWFIPGGFFTGDNDDLAYSVRGGLTVNF